MSIRKGKWTREEDARLVELVHKFQVNGDSSKISFAEVAKELEGRNAKQAQERWENNLRPGLKSGNWDKEEKIRLLKAMAKFGQQWYWVCRQIPERAFHGIKVKGRTMLGETVTVKKPSTRPNAVSMPWDVSEISALLELHSKFKYNMEKIQEQMPSIRSVASLERKLLRTCFCPSCKETSQRISLEDEDFKTAWSKHAAKKMLRKYGLHDADDDAESYDLEDNCTRFKVIHPLDHAEEYHLAKKLSIDSGIPALPGFSRGSSSSSIAQESVVTTETLKWNKTLSQFFQNLQKWMETGTNDKCKQAFCKYMTSAQVLELLKSAVTPESEIPVLSDSFPYLIAYKTRDDVKDPRYDLEFLFPQDRQFSDNSAVGTVAFENSSCIALDCDETAKDIVNVKPGSHWVHMQSSPLQGFFMFGNMYARLMEEGEVWCHQLMFDPVGKLRIYLTNVTFGYFGKGVCRFRLQDVTDRYPHVRDLPPDL